ncbi:hypothetical protein JB92DRAFT_2825270 [Gautieria morchelliformis]|nr:hypothetical protein JB92DRAFT_2825270 [Gautieria morchelliformis]
MCSRPVIRFCDISKYIKDTEAGSIKIPTSDAISHPTTSSSTETLLVEHTDEVAENKEVDDGLWEDDEEEEENSDLKFARETASSSTMDIEVDDGVDIVFPQLHDYLSEHLALPPLVNVREDPTVMKKAAGGTPRVF